MTKTTLTALGAALIALGQELQGETSETTTTEQQPTTGRRGRPAKTENPPAEPAKEPTGTPETELRKLIEPLVTEGRGEEVKNTIKKHGGTKLSDLPPASHAAFIRDIEALSI